MFRSIQILMDKSKNSPCLKNSKSKNSLLYEGHFAKCRTGLDYVRVLTPLF